MIFHKSIAPNTQEFETVAEDLAIKSTQLPSLNGWRAVSICLVLGCHVPCVTGFPSIWGKLLIPLFDGDLGVRFFFTISGFLITWLMLREENECGTISLKHFYIRRALRILPVYLACLFVLAILEWNGVIYQSRAVWIQLLTFTRNFHQTAHLEFLVSGPFWSLSVEEQFYLVWPFFFLILGRQYNRRIVFLICMVLLSIIWKCVAILGCYSRYFYFLFDGHSSFLYVDCIAYGCIGAILLATRKTSLIQFFLKNPLLITVLVLFFLLIPEIMGIGKGLQSLAFIFLLMQSVLFPQMVLYQFLNSRWLVVIGILSYSIYIWHMAIFQIWPFPKLWFLALPVALFVSGVSYFYLEKPFFTLRAKYRRHCKGVSPGLDKSW